MGIEIPCPMRYPVHGAQGAQGALAESHTVLDLS